MGRAHEEPHLLKEGTALGGKAFVPVREALPPVDRLLHDKFYGEFRAAPLSPLTVMVH